MPDAVSWIESYTSQLRMLPVLFVMAILAFLVGLGRWKQVAPYGPLAIVLLAPCLLSLSLVLFPQAFLLVATVDLVIMRPQSIRNTIRWLWLAWKSLTVSLLRRAVARQSMCL